MKDETKPDGAALLLGEVFRRGVKQQQEQTERERDEFRRRIRTEETD